MQLVRHDLEFILEQIRIADAHTAGQDLLSLVGAERLPYGLRTVSGMWNNITLGQQNFGAADRPMPTKLGQTFRAAESTTMDLDGPGPMTVGTPTSYAQTSGYVFDSQPRTISNLISHQGASNPAAVAVHERVTPGQVSSDGSLFIGAVAPDEGLSAPFNSLFTTFGQFFDHGLDKIGTGGNGTVIMPLKNDDPLVLGKDGVLGTADDLPAHLRFMTMTRATVASNAPGVDGVLGTADDVRSYTNSTSPFVDLSQNYSSHPSHQVFLREYELNAAGRPVSTGKLAEGAGGAIINWGEVKQMARTMLGIELTDTDVFNVPVILTDMYGKFIPGANGLPQLVTSTGTIEGNLTTPVRVTADVLRTGHAFLDDMAHTAKPGTVADVDRNPATPDTVVGPDADTVAGNAIGTDSRGRNLAYDNELLDKHFIVGDGRGNENIVLTAIHSVFHSEHNRIADQVKQVAVADFNAALLGGSAEQIESSRLFLNQWLDVGVASGRTTPVTADSLDWNGEKIWQAAKFTTEMQYQHFVFEGFVRKINPAVNVFSGYNTTVDPAIMAEFANVVYRFGHSMLTDTVDRINTTTGETKQIGLIQAFLNPLEFIASGANEHEAAGAIVNGMVHQRGNAIDEFVTESLQSNLLGLPLDLAALNIARGRDTGTPSLNAAREMFFRDTGLSILMPYKSWADFEQSMKNPESLVNFVAAYGTHSTITAATTLDGKRAAAQALVDQNASGDNTNGAVDFINASGAFAGGKLGGLNDVDFWIGGLAEATQPFGSMLGSTFDYVFVTQMLALQNNDRFYYLSRTLGLNVLLQLEQGSMAELFMRNTSAKHLPGDVFSTPDFTFEMSAVNASGVIVDNAATAVNEALLTRSGTQIRFAGAEHIVMGGTEGADNMRAGAGDDTLYGDGGNDRLEGGAGNDFVLGGEGDDILTDLFGDDQIKGAGGNDVISNSSGFDLLFGGDGKDVIFGGDGNAESFAGAGDDFVWAGTGINTVFGNSGNDWIEGGDGADLLQGDNGDPFQVSTVIGHDVLFGDGNDDYDAESGDDIMFGTPGINRSEGMLGFDWVTYARSTEIVNADLANSALLPPALDNIKDRFDLVEGVSGYENNDTLKGTDLLAATQVGHELTAEGVARIAGLNVILNGATNYNAAATGLGTAFTGGEIILGGGGNDTITGGAGDDVMDGDAWLNARISATDNNGVVTSHTTLLTLTAQLLNGSINPGNLVIVREILQAGTAGDADIAVFNGLRANYTIGAVLADGSRVITDNVGTDGVDLVRNIEIARFTDQDVLIGNARATGAITISDTTPTEGTAVTASTATIADRNGLGAFSFQWQTSGNGTIWTDITGATTASFNPTQTQVGLQLRVLVRFTDQSGFAEQLTSAATTVVGDLFTGTAGADTFVGTAGADNADGNAGNDTLSGGAGDDTLSGGGGADSLTGGDGNDSLDGGAGNDTMVGGAGDDTYVVAQAGDVVTETANNGIDTIRTSLASLTLATLTNVEHLTATGTAAFTGTGNDLANSITGNTGNDSLTGGAGNDTLSGGAGNDTLNGGDGNDSIDGGAGNDSMVGGAGDDIYVVDAALDTITDTAGTDSVQTTLATFTLATGLEHLTYTGAAAFTGTGNASNNTLISGAGNDTLDGGAGADSMNGGAGNDTYTVDNAGDTVTDSAGTDSIRTSLTSFSLAGLTSIENLSFTGSVAFTGTGNGLDNTLTGGTGSDTLSGGAGNDTLIGGTGNDSIDGGDGNDSIDGGAGNDTMTGGAGDDIFVVDAAGDVISDTSGIDTATVSVTGFTAGAGIENLTIAAALGIAVTANDLANTVTGGVGNDTIDGAAGSDTLIGGTGNDSLIGGDGNDSIDGGVGDDAMVGGAGDDTYVVDSALDTITDTSGTDTVQTSVANYSIAANASIENLIYTGTAAFTGTGNSGSNMIMGSTGNDTIDGGAGNDVMMGGAGNDTYIVDAAGDLIIDSAGTDTVRTSLTGYTLAAGIENLTIVAAVGIASGAVSAVTGNDLANTITGDAGNDIIDGGAGSDSLLGAAGNDSLIGGAGNDSLTGGAGADTLTGGAGSDVFIYTATIGESLTATRDVITDFVRGQDRINLSGLDANTATAGDQAFTFRGALAFNGAAQLRMQYDAVNNLTLITGNTNATTTTIELEIALVGNFTTGVNTLVATDFVL